MALECTVVDMDFQNFNYRNENLNRKTGVTVDREKNVFGLG